MKMNHSSSTNSDFPNALNTQGNREAIVDKLHGALAVLRKERDELHRAKEMAIERLRLAKEERVNAEKNLSLMQERYECVASTDAQRTRRDEIEKLEEQAQRLGREVRIIFCACVHESMNE
jgi:chromosome segregation ATPase